MHRCHERHPAPAGHSLVTRILQVCAVDFTALHLLRPLLLACREVGWDAEFACAPGPFATRLAAEGFVHWPVPIARSPSPAPLIRASLVLAAALQRRGVDLVHTHTPAGGLVGRAAALAWSGPVVHTFHGLPLEGPARTLVERGFLVAERVLARRTTYFLSQAAGDAARAAELRIARPANTLVIGNGVDLNVFKPDALARARTRAALGIPEGALVAMTVARLVREKGLLDLADAAVGLVDEPDLHFVLVGEDLPSDRTGVRPELDAHVVVGALGPRWRRLGHRTDIAALLAAADIFVLPTYREGLPRSVVEAMATGLPVVATDIPACRELVREGLTGMLVPPRDTRALMHAVGSLTRDRVMRAAMGRHAREIAEAQYDERDVLGKQLEVFQRLLGARRRG